jgi:Ca2+-binding RTX toxin-like protein
VNRRIILVLSGAALLAVIFSAGVVMSAANSVSTSGLEDVSNLVNPNQLKPPECNAINITNVLVVTSGVPFTSPGNTNDLILGTSGADTISAGNGQDCVVGGGGNDTINGNQRADVLLGGPGNDDLDGGVGNDICYSGGGTDTFNRCETILP